jgi:hypothetical protein
MDNLGIFQIKFAFYHFFEKTKIPHLYFSQKLFSFLSFQLSFFFFNSEFPLFSIFEGKLHTLLFFSKFFDFDLFKEA